MFDESLAQRIRPLVASAGPVTERKMFGGVAFMVAGNMACGIVRDSLMVRTGPDNYDAALARPHARLMDFTGRPSRGMVYVGPEGLDDETLAEWVAMGVAYASSLPAKA